MIADSYTIDRLAGLLDTIVADPAARAEAQQRLERLRLEGSAPSGEGRVVPAAAAVVEPRLTGRPADPWVSRARPAFLYVMYALLLWSLPIGVVAGIDPMIARRIAGGMAAYLAAIPEPLYALFATGYLGYTVARSWGKARGVER